MNPRTILTMCNGRNVDLLKPAVADIDFHVLAEHLAKINRYNGATPGITYSVAEHSVRGCDIILRNHHDGILAAYFLCHDMHEAFLGDDTTPKKRTLAAIGMQSFGMLADQIEQAFQAQVNSFDLVIHQAAGLDWPMRSDLAAAVKRYDTIMLATEWRDLMKCPPPYDFGAEPIASEIIPWDWRAACAEFINRCDALLPKLRSAA
jgi:5'-deoxynucleotidase YfbR-like HD superfamily hydrolase